MSALASSMEKISKVDLEPELEVSSLEARPDGAEACGREARPRQVEIGVISKVEGLEAKLETGRLRDPEVPEQREVDVDQARPLDRATARVAILECGRQHDNAGVEPLLR